MNILEFFLNKHRVKQGDSLRPILLNCFINNLHSIFDGTCDPVCLDETSINSLSFTDDLVYEQEYGI